MKHILIGWGKKWGFLPTSEAEAKLSALRLQICGSCPQAQESAVLKLIGPDEMDFVQTLQCTICKCPCEAKTLVLAESCPLKNW